MRFGSRVHSDNFHDGVGLDVHVRTTIESYFSYVETGAVKIGRHVLEVNRESFLLNGEFFLVDDEPMNEPLFELLSDDGSYKYTGLSRKRPIKAYSS